MNSQVLATIDTITQFELQPNLDISNKLELLERSLVKIYNLYFEVEYIFDEKDYSDFDKAELPDIRRCVVSNFP